MSLAEGKVAFLFPGQGAQEVGMGKDLAENVLSAREVFKRANDILGMSIDKLCFEGPEDQLTRTLYAQPAIFVVSMAALAVLKEKFPDLRPHLAAGLSLGEFSALAGAGAIEFDAALKLVRLRAAAMEDAAGLRPGTMASILGLSPETCRSIADEAGCEVANLNSPEQIVLSGTFEAVDKACRLAEAQAAQRVIPLKVGGAFHSSLMGPARERLEEALRNTVIRKPDCLFVPNVAACEVSDPDQIRDLLAKQLTHPVRWAEAMAFAGQSGVTAGLEIGFGKVLKGLARKCGVPFPVHACGSLRDFEKIPGIANAAPRT